MITISLSDNIFYNQINSMMRKVDGFYDLANYPNDPASIGTRDIKKNYSVTLPNIIYNNDSDMNLVNLTKTSNLRASNSQSVLNNDWKKDATVSNSAFARENAACENVGSGDQFTHLSNLASSVDTNSRLRCGWIYNNSNPTASRGALGIPAGPLKKSVPGTWIWDLNDAKNKQHVAICKNITDCGDISASMYQGRCGWCKKSGKAVPIDASGKAAYPFNHNTACPTSKLIKSSGSCPVEGFANPSACTPLPNGALPRKCLLQKVIAAGCSDSGTLYQSLNSGSENDYLNLLRPQKSWSIYQQRTAIPIDETALKTGKITISDALNDFSRVQDQAASEANGGLQYAARDLCYKNGAINEYDFCSEITDTTNGPFTLACLQAIFLRGGGQKTGRKYPSASTASSWNSLGTWADVKIAIQKLKVDTQSSNRTTQENAMIDFYGIQLENKQKPLTNGSVIEASYGVNCNPALRGNRTQLFQNLANTNSLKDYRFNYWTTGGDPAGGCGKTLEIKYQCPSGVKTFIAPPEAGFGAQVNLECKSGVWDNDTQMLIDAFENTGWIPIVTWGTTPVSSRRLGQRSDVLICPYLKEKYGSYDNMPAKYILEANFCKRNNL